MVYCLILPFYYVNLPFFISYSQRIMYHEKMFNITYVRGYIIARTSYYIYISTKKARIQFSSYNFFLFEK